MQKLNSLTGVTQKSVANTHYQWGEVQEGEGQNVHWDKPVSADGGTNSVFLVIFLTSNVTYAYTFLVWTFLVLNWTKMTQRIQNYPDMKLKNGYLFCDMVMWMSSQILCQKTPKIQVSHTLDKLMLNAYSYQNNQSGLKPVVKIWKELLWAVLWANPFHLWNAWNNTKTVLAPSHLLHKSFLISLWKKYSNRACNQMTFCHNTYPATRHRSGEGRGTILLLHNEFLHPLPSAHHEITPSARVPGISVWLG